MSGIKRWYLWFCCVDFDHLFYKLSSMDPTLLEELLVAVTVIYYFIELLLLMCY